MDLMDLVFPVSCLECGKPGAYICAECLMKVKPAKPICAECKKGSIDGHTHIKCRTRDSLDGLISAWKYDGVIRSAIIALKYKFVSRLIGEVSHYLSEALSGFVLPFADSSFLIPVPMHRLRENTRGFNQSAEIGKRLARARKWGCIPDLVSRTNIGSPQVALNAVERKTNVKGVFALNNRYNLGIQDRSFVIFDDVYTTGSTMQEISRVLKRRGASRVWGVTIVRQF